MYRIICALACSLVVSACYEEELVPSTQLHLGFNASSKAPPTAYYTSADDVRRSWIATALTSDELSSVMAQVDFGKQVLIAMSAGELSKTTGSIYIKKVTKYHSSITPHMYVGVIDSKMNCNVIRRKSFPFVLFTIVWSN